MGGAEVGLTVRCIWLFTCRLSELLQEVAPGEVLDPEVEEVCFQTGVICDSFSRAQFVVVENRQCTTTENTVTMPLNRSLTMSLSSVCLLSRPALTLL